MDLTTMIGISAKASERVISNPLDKGREEKKLKPIPLIFKDKGH
jgi:hypothetical protein